MPFTVTSSVSGGAGTIGAVTTTTTASSKEDVSCTANWSLGALPVATNDVVFENSSNNILWNLDALAAIALNSVRWESTFTGTCGLPEFAAGGYAEYRAKYFQTRSTTTTVGTPGTATNGGSSRIYWDNQTFQTTIVVYATGQGNESPGLEAFLFKGTHASNTLECLGGQTGVAVLAGEVATIATLRVGGTAAVRCGPVVTLTTVTQSTGSTLVTDSAITTVNHDDGVHLIRSGAITTLTIDAGTVIDTGTGTITTVNLSGTLDLSQDLRALTITTLNLFKPGFTFKDPWARATITNPVTTPKGVRLQDGTFDAGTNRTYAVV